MKLPGKLTRAFGKTGFTIKKHSPEILIVAGIAGVVTSAVMACKATTKLNKVVEKNKAVIDDVKELKHQGDKHIIEYSEKEYRKDITAAYAHMGLDFVKLYGPAVTLGTLSLASIVASNNILRGRNVALAAAYSTLDSGFKKYRKNVVERFGEELDKEFRYGVKAKEVEEKVVDEKGKETTIKKTVKVADPNKTSDFARFFDDGCTGWTKSPEMNLFFLKQQQNWANDKLKSQGYLFLNDVYESLGIPKTTAGQIVGWLYDEKHPNGDNFVDFGIYDLHKEANRDFVNGYERTILLDFNVDGPIVNLI